MVPTDFGDALRVTMRWGVGTLARKPTLGWVFDATDHLVTRRIDLARYATGTASTSPGLATDDAALLVQAVAAAVDEAEWEPTDGRPRYRDTGDVLTLDAVAAWWLRELGYRGVECGPRNGMSMGGWPHGIRGPLHVVATSKRCDLSAVKTAFADAALKGKPLVMFAAGGYTRNASWWANDASVALFEIDGQFHIWPASGLAIEHVPHVI